MKSKGHRRQIALFVAAIFLPALLLSVITLRMVRQERELFQKRAGDARLRTATEIGRVLSTRLEDIRRRAAAILVSDPNAFHHREILSPAIALIAKYSEGRLLFPWEQSAETSKKRTISDDKEFNRFLRQGEEEEYHKKNFKAAADLYRQAAARAQSSVRKSDAVLRQARVLAASGLGSEALRIYDSIMAISPEETDEYGIPFRLFAAERLASASGDSGRILRAVEDTVVPRKWLPPAALFMSKDILEILQKAGPNPTVTQKAAELGSRIDRDLAVIEQVAGLQTAAENQAEASDKPNPGIAARSRWSTLGNEPWLYSPIGDFPGSDSYILVITAPSVLKDSLQESGLKISFPGSVHLSSEESLSGEPLGAPFPGLRLRFDNMDAAAWIGSAPPGPLIYWLAMVLVIGATAFGMSLFLRDVRRESRLAALRSQFVASVSHELKTPLTSIRIFAESLLLDWIQDPANRTEYLQTIVGESERLSRLINNVLDFSKIEQGTRTYRMEPVFLPEAVRRAVLTMDFPLRQQGFNLRLEIDDGLPRIKADRDSLEQAVLNLLHNAMKYSGDRREIGITLRRSGAWAVIEVKDQGPGIREEDQARIFEKFFRVESPENLRIPGTGLGLTIVRHIAAAHGGRIDVESRPGEGSLFILRIPLEARP
jgi:signal transduction histidine kinase